MNIKHIIGIVAIVIALVGYIPYIRDMIAGKTKPHIFSWLVWGIQTLIGFMAQISDNAGPGAWPTGLTVFICFFIVIYGARRGIKNATPLDWFAFSMGIGATLVWAVTQTPLYSVLLITVADIFGWIPTIRKTYAHPYSETLGSYMLIGTKHVLSLFALQHFSVITALYPLYLVIMNIFFILLVISRRSHVRAK
jgi:hypothetical protein